MTLNTFKKELNDLLNTKIPEGYIEVNAEKHKEKNCENKNPKL